MCIHARGQPQLVDSIWQERIALDPATGSSLVNGGEAAFNLPAFERKIEERGQQGFEGPEKTLKVEFDPDIGHENGLRAIRRDQWDVILAQVLYGGCACPHAGPFFALV